MIKMWYCAEISSLIIDPQNTTVHEQDIQLGCRFLRFDSSTVSMNPLKIESQNLDFVVSEDTYFYAYKDAPMCYKGD